MNVKSNELEEDLYKISQFGKNVSVFTPNETDIYRDEIVSKRYDLGNLDTVMEGKIRKGHFQGVATVLEYFFKNSNLFASKNNSKTDPTFERSIILDRRPS